MLKVTSPQEAWNIIRENTLDIVPECETVSLFNSLGRVTGEDVFSGESIPNFDRSTVDGFAVKASDTYGSSESLPAMLKITGEIMMGEMADGKIESGECMKISTGGMLPKGADSAVMVENTETTLDDFMLCMKALSPYSNVTGLGDDVKENDLIIKKGTLITSRHIAVLSAIGMGEICVYKRLKVGVISSGDEVVPVNEVPKIGQVRDVNSHALCALMREKGCDAVLYGIAPDSFDSFVSLLKKASCECQIVLISGGSSAGTRDMTVKALSSMGSVLFHGIAMKPGKPTIFGKVGNKAVFGLPGHPMAAYIVAMKFVVPMVQLICGGEKKDRAVTAILKENISSNHGRHEVVPVILSDGYAQPILRKSGIISVLSAADGYIEIERNREGLKENEQVQVHLF